MAHWPFPIRTPFFSGLFGAPRRGAEVFAIIQSGGRQMKVSPGDVVAVDHFEAQPGDEVSIDQVLVLEKDGGEVLAGSPFVAGVRVVGVVDGEAKGPKIRVFRKKRRKGMRRTTGHRSIYTTIRITSIEC